MLPIVPTKSALQIVISIGYWISSVYLIILKELSTNFEESKYVSDFKLHLVETLYFENWKHLCWALAASASPTDLDW